MPEVHQPAGAEASRRDGDAGSVQGYYERPVAEGQQPGGGLVAAGELSDAICQRGPVPQLLRREGLRLLA